MSYGIKYFAENVRHDTSYCETAINHFKIVCLGIRFTIQIQILQKLPGNSYRNGLVDSQTLDCRLQNENYSIKTLRTVYLRGMNQRK